MTNKEEVVIAALIALRQRLDNQIDGVIRQNVMRGRFVENDLKDSLKYIVDDMRISVVVEETE